MKIAIINDLLGKGSNGTFLVTYNLLEHLKECGHEVKVICADERKRSDPDYVVLPARHFGVVIDRYLDKVGVCVPKCSKADMVKLLDGVEYIHCITPFRLERLAAEYADKNGIPVSTGFHVMAENITSYFRLRKFVALNRLIYKYMYRSLYSKVGAVHYPTRFIKNYFHDEIGKTTTSYVISNGVNSFFGKIGVVRPPEYKDKIIVTSVRRYSHEKAQEVLIKAVSRSKYRDDILLVLAGHGGRENYYNRLSDRLGVNVILKTFDREEMVKLLNVTDIYVHPAIVELEGIACLEALRCGLPVVTAYSPQSATYVFASNEDCIFESGNFNMLADILDRLISSPALRLAAAEDSLRKTVLDTSECMLKMDDMIKQICAASANDLYS